MKKQILATATALGVTLALAGCTAGSSTPNPSAEPFDPSKLVASTPAGTTAVDLVKWGMLVEPRTVDPVRAGVETEYQTVANLCDTVLRLQPDFSVEPGLAESAEWVNETTFVISLRDDVVFWDGTPLTAEDVAFSLMRSANPESQSVNTGAFERVDSIEATAPLEVTVTMTEPDSQFRNAMAGPAGYVFQKAFTENVGEEAIGTADGGVMCSGPFEFTDWVAGERITLTANPDYWDGEPLVSTLELTFVANDSTMTSALLAGELDGMFSVPTSGAQRLIDSGVGELFVGPSTAAISISATTSEGPAADPRVRAALDLAIDKPSYINAVLGGYGAPLRTFTPPFAWEGLEAADVYRAGYEALEDNTEADIAKAKELLKDAEAEGASLVLAIQAGEEQSMKSATIVQAAAESIGLSMEIRQLQGAEFSSLFYEEEARAGIDFLGTTGYLDTPGVLLYATMFAQPGGQFNYSGFDDPQVGELLAAAATEVDPVASAEAFVEAQALFTPARLLIPLASEYTRVFLNSELTGVTTSFSYIASPWALHLGGK